VSEKPVKDIQNQIFYFKISYSLQFQDIGNDFEELNWLSLVSLLTNNSVFSSNENEVICFSKMYSPFLLVLFGKTIDKKGEVYSRSTINVRMSCTTGIQMSKSAEFDLLREINLYSYASTIQKADR